MKTSTSLKCASRKSRACRPLLTISPSLLALYLCGLTLVVLCMRSIF